MKKLWLFLIAGLLLACICPMTPLIPPTHPLKEPEPVESAEQVLAGNLSLLRLHPENGDLANLLQEEAPKATALGQHMFVSFDATW
jgi:hypothetical protein